MIRINNINIIDKYINITDDILIEGSKIKYIGKEKIDKVPSDDIDTVIDGTDKFLSPSFIDLHFHLRNPGQEYKQTYEEASNAAIKGGYTTVVAMANTKPVVDEPSIIDEIYSNMEKFPLRVIQTSAITKGLNGSDLVDFESIRNKTNIFSDDGKNIDSEKVLSIALEKSAELDFIIMDHDEPETEMVIRNLKILRELGKGRLHFCHISKKESIDAIVKAKENNKNITFEFSPHHIFSKNLNYRVNPPIGNDEDNLAIISAIKNNLVDAIATDHAPHTEEEKQIGAPGIVNIENAFSMVRKIFVDNDIDLQKQIELMSNNPSEILGEDNRIKEGNTANLVIYNDEEYLIDKTKFETRSINTPFDKCEVKGKILYTIVGGKVYDNGFS